MSAPHDPGPPSAEGNNEDPHYDIFDPPPAPTDLDRRAAATHLAVATPVLAEFLAQALHELHLAAARGEALRRHEHVLRHHLSAPWPAGAEAVREEGYAIAMFAWYVRDELNPDACAQECDDAADREGRKLLAERLPPLLNALWFAREAAKACQDLPKRTAASLAAGSSTALDPIPPDQGGPKPPKPSTAVDWDAEMDAWNAKLETEPWLWLNPRYCPRGWPKISSDVFPSARAFCSKAPELAAALFDALIDLDRACARGEDLRPLAKAIGHYTCTLQDYAENGALDSAVIGALVEAGIALEDTAEKAASFDVEEALPSSERTEMDRYARDVVRTAVPGLLDALREGLRRVESSQGPKAQRHFRPSSPEDSHLEGRNREELEWMLVRVGDAWKVGSSGKDIPLPHRTGLLYLRELLRSPNKPVSSEELLRLKADGRRRAESGAEEESVAEHCAPNDGAEEVMDEAGLRRMVARAKEIRTDLDQLDENDARREPLGNELAEIQAYLRAARRPGGRTRRLDDQVHRIRRSVGQELTRAIKAIARINSKMGDHLEQSIRQPSGATPTYCPVVPIHWRLD